ncbi:MAG: GNAT family N-acetyltransferase [Burkholderiales bacterium]|nr:GNAT family N-acetyltransferase [Burkholderiales bacterium]
MLNHRTHLKPLRMLLMPLRLGKRALRACWQWCRSFRVELRYAEGLGKGTCLPISILFAAADQDKEYLLRLVFEGPHRERRVGRYWLWNLQKAIRTVPDDCSMMIIETDASHLRFAQGGPWFLIPLWLLGQIDLPYEQRVTSKMKAELRRRIRRSDFRFEVTQDPGAFDDFYHRMYVPHIINTYGESALIESYEEMKGHLQDGELLLVRKDEQFIAGQLIRYLKAGPFLWQLGIRDNNRQYVQAGVAAACYHFCLQYLHEQGHVRAFLGWSRAFLKDGVLRFKRSLSQRIVPARNPDGFALRILSPTAATAAFLSRNPFILQRQGNLEGAVFVDDFEKLDPKQADQIQHEYFHPGLSRLLCYNFQGERAMAPRPVPAAVT